MSSWNKKPVVKSGKVDSDDDLPSLGDSPTNFGINMEENKSLKKSSVSKEVPNIYPSPEVEEQPIITIMSLISPNGFNKETKRHATEKKKAPITRHFEDVKEQVKRIEGFKTLIERDT